ncbi:MAG TPA: ABC transporter ATP-binding protein [Solirubrobacteraceae bacterium]|nr:ABC transporter ATP-binding protein [Solirubrobacteraceae bacterium]
MAAIAPTAAAGPLVARSLTRAFGARVALRDVSFELAPGELVGVIGPNGAGKTTLLSILAGVLEPDSGELRGAGRTAGWVPQQPAVYSRLSVSENLRLFARLERVADVNAAVERMLDHAGLRAHAADRVDRLSGGLRQRVNVAIGLLRDPDVLLLDEPSSALDPRQRARLWDLILDLAGRGTTVVFSTHDIAEVQRYADRVLLLADGELLFCGTCDELVDIVGLRSARRASPDRGGGVSSSSPSRMPSAGAHGSADEGRGRPPDLESALVAFLRGRGH